MMMPTSCSLTTGKDFLGRLLKQVLDHDCDTLPDGSLVNTPHLNPKTPTGGTHRSGQRVNTFAAFAILRRTP